MGEERARDMAVRIGGLEPAAPRAAWSAPGDILTIAMRRRWQITLVILASVLVALSLAMTSTPRYISTATVMLDVYQSDIADIRAVAAGVTSDSRDVRSQVEVLVSRNVLGRVVDSLELTTDPYFNPTLDDTPPSVLRFLNPLYYMSQARAGVSAVLSSIKEAASSEETAMQRPVLSERDRAIDILRASTTVAPVHFSFVFNISVELPDARKSALVANEIARQYILNQIDLKYERTEQATAWLRQRVEDLRVQLEEAEAALAVFLEKSGLRPEDSNEALLIRLGSARDRLAEIEEQRAELLNRRAALDAIDPGRMTVEDLRDLGQAGVLNGIERVADMIERGQSGARETLRTLTENQRQRVATDIANADINIANLRRNIEQVEEQLRSRSEQLTKLGQLMREKETVAELYQTFLSRLGEASVQRGVYTADAVVISEARMPVKPAFPRNSSFFLGGLMAGTILAALLVGLLEALDRSFRLTEEIEAQTGYPVIGSIPQSRGVRNRSPIEHMEKNPTSPFSEAIRNLRTSIQLSNVDRKAKVVCFTSAVQREGKTTTAVATAQSFGARSVAGRRVVVVDLDLRVRRVTKLMLPGRESAPGFLAYMSGQAALDEIITRDTGASFDVIGVEETVKVTTDLFASQRFEQLLTQLRGTYDVVILDTPPVLALSDVRLIARRVDMLIFAVRWKATTHYLVQHALHLLGMFGTGNLSIVMTHVDLGKSTGYGGYYNYR